MSLSLWGERSEGTKPGGVKVIVTKISKGTAH